MQFYSSKLLNNRQKKYFWNFFKWRDWLHARWFLSSLNELEIALEEDRLHDIILSSIDPLIYWPKVIKEFLLIPACFEDKPLEDSDWIFYRTPNHHEKEV